MLGAMIDSPQNESKFERLYKLYANMMRAVAFDMLQNQQDAEDIVAVSLVKVIGILDDIVLDDVDTKRTKNLMITITKNTAIDHLRKRKNDPVPCEYIESQRVEKGVEDIYIDYENVREVISCIDELEDKYRVVLQLKVIHQLSSKEAAEILNISEMNVNMRFMRARRILNERIKEHRKNEQRSKK